MYLPKIEHKNKNIEKSKCNSEDYHKKKVKWKIDKKWLEYEKYFKWSIVVSYRLEKCRGGVNDRNLLMA